VIAGAGIQNQTDSQKAIQTMDAALQVVNKQRSAAGATINRLTYAADNLTNISTNTSASRSRVLDADYASTTTELARSQIIQQAATAMLAQANQAPQSVLSLLK
jgi:flagellin